MATEPLTQETGTQHGLRHEVLLYGSDDELVAAAVPFVRDGLDAGEPVVLATGREHSEALRAALPEAESLVVRGDDGSYARPSRVVKAYREMFADYVAAGAQRIRILGELPGVALGPTWWWWARYESAVNRLYAEFPVWTLCVYGTRTTPEHVLDDVRRTHPYLAAPDGRHRANDRCVPVEEFVPGKPAGGDPLEAHEPLIELVDPAPADARHVVLDAADAGRLPVAVSTDSVVMVLSEAVTNAAQHGLRPVRVRLWAGTERVMVAVSDMGSGPADPLAGLVPAPHYPKGDVGLWLSHELCDHVTFERGAGGYTFRGHFGHVVAA
jgi:anti-sigma regulatory factor (Ser/Thr protein kinase)